MSVAGSDSSSVGRRAGDNVNRTLIAEMPLNVLSPSRKTKQMSPQAAVDDFWSKFTTKTPGKATQVIPQNPYADKVARKSARAIESTTQASYEEAAAVCTAKVKKIVKECRRINQKYRDPHFDLEFDLKLGRRDCLESLSNVKPATPSGGVIVGPSPDQPLPASQFNPKSVKRVVDVFDAPQFYIDGPTANDVRQGRDGDCWLMAALCTLSNKPGLIENVCVAHNQAVGVYGFVFHRDGEWFSEIIDDKLYLTKPDYDEGFLERILWEDRERVNSEEAYRKIYQTNSGALYFAQCENPNETWLPLLEKAYAKAHGDYAAIEGGFTGEGIEDLTGGVTSEVYTTDILDKEYFWKEELLKVNQDFLFGCSTGWFGRGWGERKGIIESHAYSVMKAVEMDGKRLLLLKNPWGKGEWKGPWSDGSKEWTPEWLQKLGHRFGDDGAFWISYEDLLRKYQAFDRTRLFGSDWKVTQIWTTLTVPWTLDYHDTHFAFTITKPGPVVIVLSQLDDRYFRGLEGQYRFDLAFRLHKADQEDYVVRSCPGYRQNRSVNVELDLEEGDYTVLVKIDAMRNDKVLPAEEVLKNNAKDRREKLIRIGLAYDLAHSKGKIVETPEEKARRQAYEKRKKEKEREEMKQKIIEERERTHYMKCKAFQRRQRQAAKYKAKTKAEAEKRRQAGLPPIRHHPPPMRHVPVYGRPPPPVYRGPPQVVVRSHMPPPMPHISHRVATKKPHSSEKKGGDAEEKHVKIQLPEQDGESKSSIKDGDSSIDLGEKTPSSTGSDKSIISAQEKEATTGDTTPATGEHDEKSAKEDGIPATDEPSAEKPREEDAASNTAAEPIANGVAITAKTDEKSEQDKPDTGNSEAKTDINKSELEVEMSPKGSPRSEPADKKDKIADKGENADRKTSNDKGKAKETDDSDDSHSPASGTEDISDLDPYESLSDSEAESLSSLSELSEREMDLLIDVRKQRLSLRTPVTSSVPAQRDYLDDPDEFERDPWNAVAVVGLRIYYKAGEEEPQGVGSIVKLRVVRPFDDGEEASEAKDKDADGTEPKAKGLDVDDSAKDATLEGDPAARKKSIVPSNDG